MNQERYLQAAVKRMALGRSKMAFISGPRQVGKTTLAKSLGREAFQCIYKNWDESEFRRQWTRSPNSLQSDFNLSEQGGDKILILDEIHKAAKWKQGLKGLYDEFGNDLQIIVTGSARLNVFRKGGDSLLGRYFHFRLHPLSFAEIEQKPMLEPDQWRSTLFQRPIQIRASQTLQKLMQCGGFPEPYFSDDSKIVNVWRRNRVEKLVREDLRDLSRLPELSQVEMLISLMPTKIGSPLSVQSLREDLNVHFDTVKRWLNYLQELYYYFEIRPWTKSVVRSLKREPKIYLFDWSEVEAPGPRFENLIASHLLKACHFWTDTGAGFFELYYLRNKEKQEIDFLIVKDRKPWLAIETKLEETSIDARTVDKFQDQLKIPFAQVVLRENQFRSGGNRVVISANHFLSGLC